MLHLYANAHLPNYISGVIGWIHGIQFTKLTSVRHTSIQVSLKAIKLDGVIWRISAKQDEIRSQGEVPGHGTFTMKAHEEPEKEAAEQRPAKRQGEKMPRIELPTV